MAIVLTSEASCRTSGLGQLVFGYSCASASKLNPTTHSTTRSP